MEQHIKCITPEQLQALPVGLKFIKGKIMAYIYAQGKLTGTTAVVNMPNTPVPVSVVLNSTAGGRAIQFSFDGTTFYPAVTPTYTETSQIVFVLQFPVSTIQFTGAANDTYSII
jgi:hypothetical protein